MSKWSQASHPGLPDSLCPAHTCAHVFSELHRSQRWESGFGSGCTNPPAQGPPHTHFTLALTPPCWGLRLQGTAPSAWGLRASRPPSFASEDVISRAPPPVTSTDGAVIVTQPCRFPCSWCGAGSVWRLLLSGQMSTLGCLWCPRHQGSPSTGCGPGSFRGLWARFLQRKLSLAGRLMNMSAVRKACCLYLWSTHWGPALHKALLRG